MVEPAVESKMPSYIEVSHDSVGAVTCLFEELAQGGHGFSISELSEKEQFALMMKYTPYIKFEVNPMLSADEMIEVMQEKMQQ